jgi:uncharacterized surface protein with fasciclin (FAS1) repeats
VDGPKISSHKESKMKFLKALTVASLLAIAPVAVAPVYAANVVETAQSTGTFNTLLAAATAAGLAETLATTENITVFAPTDEAFAALPAGTVEDLLKPENKDKLVAILTLHVLPRVLTSHQLLNKPFHVKTLNTSERLTISAKASGVTVSGSNTANVVQADVKADNGVIHVIDAVLLP